MAALLSSLSSSFPLGRSASQEQGHYRSSSIRASPAQASEDLKLRPWDGAHAASPRPHPSQWDLVEGPRTKAEPAAGVQWTEHAHKMQETREKLRAASYLCSPGYSQLALKRANPSAAATSLYSKFWCVWLDFFLYASPTAVRSLSQVHVRISSYFWVLTQIGWWRQPKSYNQKGIKHWLGWRIGH